jgi:very-short-patch-repair endonuclease/predicted transcriptional regulator of viral defense system
VAAVDLTTAPAARLDDEARSFPTPEMVMAEGDAALGVLASRQRGLVTREQAMRAGLSSSGIDRRLRRGRWFRLESGVYLIAGVPVDWHVKAMAACLATGGVVSHRSAAVLFSLEHFRPGPIDITVSRARRVRGTSARMHQSRDIHLFRPRRVDGIPVTPPARLAVDLGAVVPPARYRAAVEELVATGKLSWDDAATALLEHARPGRPGISALRSLILERHSAAIDESPLERAFFRLLRSAGLALPTRQLEIFDADGFVARVDFAFPAHKVAIELDSVRHHLNRVAFEADRRKRNRLELEGWCVLAFTWDAVTRRPEEVVAQIRHVLAERDA